MYEYKVDVIVKEYQNHFTFYIQIEADSEEDAKEKIEFILNMECDVLSITESN
jgi:hypothetical protein